MSNSTPMHQQHDNEWIVTSTASDNNELMKPERIYVYNKNDDMHNSIGSSFDLNEYDRLKNFDLKTTKNNIMSKSTDLVNNQNLTLARNSLDNKVQSNKSEIDVDPRLKKSFSSPNLDLNKKLTAETLRILSDIEIDKLSFDLLFNDLSTLKASAVLGLLGKTNFRCLGWMIFLECIPTDKTKWLDAINHNRNMFDKIKQEICCDPHDLQQKVLPSIQVDNSNNENHIYDHPLSNEQFSVWNKYFKNNELKSMINQDVIRIHQHNEFMGLESTQEMLVDLLFIYVELTESEYRQGMHEIYSTILFSLQEEYTKLSKLSDTNGIIKKLADLNYLEHDSFTIFQAVMKTIHDWFGSSQVNSTFIRADQNTRRLSRRFSCSIQNGRAVLDMNPKLFKEERNFYETPIINKINHITKILKDNDIEIFNHLNDIDVSLQPFGIRWLRLLFLRELDFPTMLILWDSIFATDSSNFELADYIFVAMLTCLREDILKSDNSFCMRLLMQPNIELDPLDVLKTALYLYDSATYQRPDIMESSYDVINPLTPTKTLKQTNHMSSPPSLSNISRVSSTSSKSNSYLEMNNNNNNNHSQLASKQHHQSSSTHKSKINHKYNHSNNKKELDISKIANKLDYTSPNYYYNSEEKKNQHPKDYEMNVFKMQGYGHNVDYVNFIYINKITELQSENQRLKQRLNDLEDLCNMYSMKMNANIALLQDEIVKLNKSPTTEPMTEEDDIIYLALAGLKKVRDQLNHNLSNENSDNLIDSSRNTEQSTVYRQNQEHKFIQTSLENWANELDLKSASIKQKVSSFLKKNLSKVNDLNNETAKNSIKGRMRSFSLKATSLNFPPSSVLGQFVKDSIISKTTENSNICTSSTNYLPHMDDVFSNLDDNSNMIMNFNETKLVFNNNNNIDSVANNNNNSEAKNKITNPNYENEIKMSPFSSFPHPSHGP